MTDLPWHMSSGTFYISGVFRQAHALENPANSQRYIVSERAISGGQVSFTRLDDDKRSARIVDLQEDDGVDFVEALEILRRKEQELLSAMLAELGASGSFNHVALIPLSLLQPEDFLVYQRGYESGAFACHHAGYVGSTGARDILANGINEELPETHFARFEALAPVQMLTGEKVVVLPRNNAAVA